jgi:hypothetical protein
MYETTRAWDMVNWITISKSWKKVCPDSEEN